MFGLISFCTLFGSTMTFIINVMGGVQRTVAQLTAIFNFPAEATKSYETEGIVYAVVALFTLCIGAWALFVDFAMTNSRNSSHSGSLCVGLMPGIFVSILLLSIRIVFFA